MSRNLSDVSLEILMTLSKSGPRKVELFYQQFKGRHQNKSVYNTIYRLVHQGLVEPTKLDNEIAISLTDTGELAVSTNFPEKDGTWKLIIYDIPESKRKVRNVLRAKLEQMGFKKWQSSIWISPYKLDDRIEKELKELGQKFFVRLIRVASINIENDLSKLFPE